MVEEQGPALVTLLQTPPPPLREELERLGVPHVELLSYLTVQHAGVPLSGAARQMSVARWARAHGAHVDEACVAALPALRRASGRARRARAAGTAWAPSPSARRASCARRWRRAGSARRRAARRWRTRTGSTGSRWWRRRPPSRRRCSRCAWRARCTRSWRRARCARGACAPTRCSRSSRASGARRSSSASGSRCRPRRWWRRRRRRRRAPEEEEEEEEEEELGAEEEEVAGGGLLAARECAGCGEHVQLVEGVDRALQRDYVVLAVLMRRAGGREGGRRAVCRARRSVAGDCARCRPTATPCWRMVLGHTRSVAAAGGGARAAEGGEELRDERRATATQPPAAAAAIRYGKLPPGADGARGIVLDTAAGRQVLLERVGAYLSLMHGDGDAFAARWFPSRSAKCHARRRRPGGAG